jgi:L-2-hydroxyglutarate oxidase LhgO
VEGILPSFTVAYYSPDSLKAKACRKGSLEMVANCKEQNFPINNIGKILVELNIKDATQLDLLKDRAKKNGVLAPHMIRDFIGSKFSKLRFYLYKVLKSITKSINL